MSWILFWRYLWLCVEMQRTGILCRKTIMIVELELNELDKVAESIEELVDHMKKKVGEALKS